MATAAQEYRDQRTERVRLPCVISFQPGFVLAHDGLEAKRTPIRVRLRIGAFAAVNSDKTRGPSDSSRTGPEVSQPAAQAEAPSAGFVPPVRG
jgi:hypothetical protein